MKFCSSKRLQPMATCHPTVVGSPQSTGLCECHHSEEFNDTVGGCFSTSIWLVTCSASASTTNAPALLPEYENNQRAPCCSVGNPQPSNLGLCSPVSNSPCCLVWHTARMQLLLALYAWAPEKAVLFPHLITNPWKIFYLHWSNHWCIKK